MFNTVFIEDEDDNSKTFARTNVIGLSSRVFTPYHKKAITNKIENNLYFNNFYFSTGRVELMALNYIYCLEYVPLNTDVILPKDPKLLDFVVLYYEQTTTITKVSVERLTKIKLLGNGNRIMGFDEPLICDKPFMSLRLVFMGPAEGWVVC